MPERYAETIIKYLSGKGYQPLKPRQLARQMGVSESDYGSFREAIKILRDSGRVVMGAKNALMLPDMGKQVVGTFQANPRGFGFVTPDTPNSHGDLYVPEGQTAGAMTGDTVLAHVLKRGKRGGEMLFQGRVTEIVRRGSARVVGTLDCAEDTWFVLPDGKAGINPVVIADVGPGARKGQKVVAEIVQYPAEGQLARGVITENIGAAGHIAAETIAIIRAFGLREEFPDEAMAEARRAVDTFDPAAVDGRDDLSSLTIVTIDPPDARDFDDAISIESRDGQTILGVHIADVSHFVPEGRPLDVEARERGNSVYFPRKVLPMLPEVLSNGVCSLQEGVPRLCKSAFIHYDQAGNVTARRLAETVIRSAKRLTYTEAQGIIDGKTGGYDRAVVELVRRMNDLARRIERRRREAGMLHLDLPEVEIVLDEEGKVIGAEPAADAYTHTIIEMFMVEANEAVAVSLSNRQLPFLRRIHPEPDKDAHKALGAFTRVCGHKLPRDLDRKDLQRLLESVKGRPESFAVNMAVLRSLTRAEYSPMQIGHYALASDNYCHFTSPIRRYPDLTVHRLFADVVRKRQAAAPDMPELVSLGTHCSTTEKTAEEAERELTTVLVLQFLSDKVGEPFEGVATGVTNFGLFVQLPRLGVEGLIRMQELGDDWWEVNAPNGEIRGERTGKRYRIGDAVPVRIASVDVARRQLNLTPDRWAEKKEAPNKKAKRGKGRKR
ncbi:MAG TPA: ribonuclease R [Phycisphaerae bacterium]|nr:ribonuclease R [Phycisphaerae bacterium]